MAVLLSCVFARTVPPQPDRMNQRSLAELKLELQAQAKNGLDFILAAGLLWLLITWLWTLDYSAYNRSVFTFMVGALLLPLAFGFSRILRTHWKVPDNPLQPLGLWLNFAQLVYFPFLVFVLIKAPDYFVMTYAIITGAHLFPYAWFYDEPGYAVAAVLIAVGALLLALTLPAGQLWLVPLGTAAALFALAAWIASRLRTAAPHLEET